MSDLWIRGLVDLLRSLLRPVVQWWLRSHLAAPAEWETEVEEVRVIRTVRRRSGGRRQGRKPAGVHKKERR
jgi:hypothetical protein